MMTIREYEKIYKEDCPNFDELTKFAAADNFFDLRWRCVQAKNYVGVIRLPSGFQIEILPKIDAPEDKLRGLVVKMLSDMNDFNCKKFSKAELDTARLTLYEIFIGIYLEMILELVKRGLKSSYLLREDNLKILKGKLLISLNIRRNFAHREKFFVKFDEYSINCPEHHLIKSALTKILHTTHEQKNFRLTTRLLTDFDSVEQSFNYAADFSAITHNRQNRDYLPAMAWTKIFLSAKSFTPFAGKSEVLALLFPMEKLFESYIAKHVKKIFSDSFTIRTQVKEKSLFDEPKNSFMLKPDILLESSDEKIIFDTKWKLNISESDMYQMFAYSKRYNAKKIFILCSPNVEGNFYSTTDGLNVTIFPVDVFDIDNSLKKIPCHSK